MTEVYQGGHTTQGENKELQSESPTITAESTGQIVTHTREVVEKSGTQVEVASYQGKVAGEIQKIWNSFLDYIQAHPKATEEEIRQEQGRLLRVDMEKATQVEVKLRMDDFLKNQVRLVNYLYAANGVRGPKGREDELIADSIWASLSKFIAEKDQITTDEIGQKLIQLCRENSVGSRIIYMVLDRLESKEKTKNDDIKTTEASN